MAAPSRGSRVVGSRQHTKQPVAKQRMPNRIGMEQRVHEGRGRSGETVVGSGLLPPSSDFEPTVER